MKIKRLPVGLLETNCYIVEDKSRACIIDPGADADKILSEIEADCVDKIILTHGHFDHMLAAKELKEKTGAKIFISENDSSMLNDYKKSLYTMLGMDDIGFIPVEADSYYNEYVEICGNNFEVIKTPGHSAGSVCFLNDKILFSGDTLFQGSIGRYDNGSYDDIMRSLWKLMLLDDDVSVLPGHGYPTTIGQERKGNPFLR